MYKVLIVEDEEIIRKGLIFRAAWFNVNCAVVGEAGDGQLGLAQIHALRPDIVIADVRMPFKNGIEMLEESIVDYQYEAIIISGYSDFAYAKQAISLGVTEYLLKPVDFSQLQKALEKITAKLAVNQKVEDYLQALQQDKAAMLLPPQIFASPQRSTKLIHKMLGYVKESYHQKISLRDLSVQYGRSTTCLNTKFKRETGYTFNDFLNRYRIVQAVELLRQEKLRVYEVADVVGFQDYKYFIQVFKKYIGCSPLKFVDSCVESKR